MSVIGRLDEQVDAVLITPLKNRVGHKDPATTQDARSPDPPVQSSEKKRQTPGGDEGELSEQDSSPGPNELPVWLL